MHYRTWTTFLTLQGKCLSRTSGSSTLFNIDQHSARTNTNIPRSAFRSIKGIFLVFYLRHPGRGCRGSLSFPVD